MKYAVFETFVCRRYRSTLSGGSISRESRRNERVLRGDCHVDLRPKWPPVDRASDRELRSGE
jgi:hypothetical protein